MPTRFNDKQRAVFIRLNHGASGDGKSQIGGIQLKRPPGKQPKHSAQKGDGLLAQRGEKISEKGLFSPDGSFAVQFRFRNALPDPRA